MSSSKNSSSSSTPAPEAYGGRLQEVVCRVEVVLGTGALSVRGCLALARGAVIRLARPAGADLQILVNGVAIANGEVVIADDSTAVRVTDILPPPTSGGAE